MAKVFVLSASLFFLNLRRSLVLDPQSNQVDLMAFGLGDFGQLGIFLANGTKPEERKNPSPVTGMQNIAVKQVRACLTPS